MTTRADLLRNGPLALLNQIASAFSKEAGADFRSQVTVHTRNGKTWTGIPTETVEDRSRAYIVLEIHPKKNIIVLDMTEIQAVEIENLDAVFSYLEKPWLKDGRFRSVSRLQLQRDVEALWKTIPHQKLKLELEKFPNTDDSNGALLAWVTTLKTEVDTLMSDNLGKEAMMAIDQIIVSFGDAPVKCMKENKTLHFTVALVKESFDKTLITQLLNDNL